MSSGGSWWYYKLGSVKKVVLQDVWSEMVTDKLQQKLVLGVEENIPNKDAIS